MTRSKPVLSISLCMALALPANATSQNFGILDSDGDGQLSKNELTYAFGILNAERLLAHGDQNADGLLTVREIRSSRDDGESNSGGYNPTDD